MPGLERVRVVAVEGGFHARACAVRDDGRVLCWGPGSFGIPGSNWAWPSPEPASPALVTGLEDAIRRRTRAAAHLRAPPGRARLVLGQ